MLDYGCWITVTPTWYRTYRDPKFCLQVTWKHTGRHLQYHFNKPRVHYMCFSVIFFRNFFKKLFFKEHLWVTGSVSLFSLVKVVFEEIALTHLLPMHPFSTPWKHQKNVSNKWVNSLLQMRSKLLVFPCKLLLWKTFLNLQTTTSYSKSSNGSG